MFQLDKNKLPIITLFSSSLKRPLNRKSRAGISFPFEAPKENCMVIELVKNGLDGVGGMVEYPRELGS